MTGFVFEPWIILSMSADTCAIVGIYAAIARNKFNKSWRYIHWLMYVAFAFAVSHAITVGSDLKNPVVFSIYIAMLVVVIIAFIVKRGTMKKKADKKD